MALAPGGIPNSVPFGVRTGAAREIALEHRTTEQNECNRRGDLGTSSVGRWFAGKVGNIAETPAATSAIALVRTLAKTSQTRQVNAGYRRCMHRTPPYL
jgi:hypothetical protein